MYKELSNLQITAIGSISRSSIILRALLRDHIINTLDKKVSVIPCVIQKIEILIDNNGTIQDIFERRNTEQE